MKKVFQFFLLIGVIFLPNVVGAKEVIKTCNYTGDAGGLNKENNHTLKVEIYDDYSSEATITMFYGKSMSNDESILNWNSELKDEFKKTKKCPSHSLVGWIDRFGPANEYEVYLKYDKDFSKYLYKEDESLIYDKSSTGYSEDYKEEDPDGTFEKIKNTCVGYLSKAENYNNFMTNYNIEQCKDASGGELSQYWKCRDNLNAQKTSCGAWLSSELSPCLEDGNITQKEYKDAESVCENINKFHKEKISEIRTKEKMIKDNKQEAEKEEPKNFNDSNIEYAKCGSLDRIPLGVPAFTNNVFTLVKVLVPIVLVLLGMIDFARAVVSGNEDKMRESTKKFVRRIAGGLLVFFVLALTQFLVRVSDPNEKSDMLTCMKCFIVDDDNCGSYIQESSNKSNSSKSSSTSKNKNSNSTPYSSTSTDQNSNLAPYSSN